MPTDWKILFLGYNNGTSLHRAQALWRLGHIVTIINPWDFLFKNKWLKRILSKYVLLIGPSWLEPYVCFRLAKKISNCTYDMLWNDQCELIGPLISKLIKKKTKLMVSYSNDDAFGVRDKKRFLLYRKSVKYYDLTVVCRTPNIEEAYSNGARNVHRIYLPADEIAHQRLLLSPKETEHWSTEVVFIGTWMPERGPFLKRLLELGVPITIYGNRWERAPEWHILKKAWRGPGLIGEDYVKVIQSAKICLGLLSKGNRDLHTRRSVEIPYIGTVLCAERTEEHLEMYEEDVEAVFWDSPEECAEKCFLLLEDTKKRKKIAEAGHRRCLQNGYLNQNILAEITAKLYEK